MNSASHPDSLRAKHTVLFYLETTAVMLIDFTSVKGHGTQSPYRVLYRWFMKGAYGERFVQSPDAESGKNNGLGTPKIKT